MKCKMINNNGSYKILEFRGTQMTTTTKNVSSDAQRRIHQRHTSFHPQHLWEEQRAALPRDMWPSRMKAVCLCLRISFKTSDLFIQPWIMGLKRPRKPGNVISMHGKYDNTAKSIQQIALQSLHLCHCGCEHLQVSCHLSRIRKKKIKQQIVFLCHKISSISRSFAEFHYFQRSFFSFHGRCQCVTQTAALLGCCPCPSLFGFCGMLMTFVWPSCHDETKGLFQIFLSTFNAISCIKGRGKTKTSISTSEAEMLSDNKMCNQNRWSH